MTTRINNHMILCKIKLHIEDPEDRWFEIDGCDLPFDFCKIKCLYNKKNICYSKYAISFKKGKTNSVCVMHYEDEREMYAKLILKNIEENNGSNS